MSSDLWKLNVICEKHGITQKQASLLLRTVEAGGLDSNVLSEHHCKIAPKLQIILDDFVEAGFIGKEEME